MRPLLTRYPTAVAKWLQAVQVASGPVDEVAIVGDADDDATRSLVRAITNTSKMRACLKGKTAPERRLAYR